MSSSNVIHVNFAKLVQLSGNEKISLRDVWEQLKIRKHFTQWAKKNLKLFKENEDFGSFNLNLKRETGATVLKEYWVTVDTAKQICMLSRTEEGRRVRRYFIECEKLLHANELEPQTSCTPRLMDRDVLMFLATEYQKFHAEYDMALARPKDSR